MSERVRLVIADDHPIFLEGMLMMLGQRSEYRVDYSAGNGDEILRYLSDHPADILLTDINMPGADGIALCKEVRQKFPSVKVVALTMHNDLRHVTQMMKAGASGYILKNASKEEILECVERVVGGDVYISREARDHLVDEMTQTSIPHVQELSSREKEVLRLLADGNTAAEIAAKLFLSEHTVISHRKKLIFKLGARNTAGLIKFAMENHLIQK